VAERYTLRELRLPPLFSLKQFSNWLIVLGALLPLFAARPKLPERYDKWLKQDVVYIISDEERKAFLQLQTDAERDHFIDHFWDIRNPERGSGHNRYKEEIYARIEYANEHFGRMSNTPGWMTDMGRAYIELGKPISMHEFIGNGQIYPLALWSYANNTGDPALPSFFNLLFFQAEDIEEYRFYRPFLDGPMKLVRGSNFNSNRDVYKFLMPLGGDVAHAAFSLIPNDPVDTRNFQPEMSSDMLISRIQNLANSSYNVHKLHEMEALREQVRSYMLISQDRAPDLTWFALADPVGQYWLDYAVAIDSPEMGAAAASGEDLNVRIDYRLTTPSGGLIVEDSEERAYRAFSDKTFLTFEVANRLPIMPGQYKLEVDVVNAAAGKTWRVARTIDVSPAKEVTLRGPLVSGGVSRAAQPNGFTPFEYYGIAFHPSATRNFVLNTPLTVLCALERPAGESAAYSIEYALANTSDRTQRYVSTDVVNADDFRDGRLLKSKTISLEKLSPGEYRLAVNIRAADGRTVQASANVALTLANDRPAPVLYLAANSRNMARPGVASYIRGLEAVAQKDEAKAVEYLHQALEQNPANSFAGDYLVQLYFRRRNYGGVAEVYRRLGIEAFRNSPQAMAAVGLSVLETGQKAEARKILVAARAYFPSDPTLANAIRQVEKAR